MYAGLRYGKFTIQLIRLITIDILSQFALNILSVTFSSTTRAFYYDLWYMLAWLIIKLQVNAFAEKELSPSWLKTRDEFQAWLEK
jgi:hypothetical protein